jgi:hypothetical protein
MHNQLIQVGVSLLPPPVYVRRQIIPIAVPLEQICVSINISLSLYIEEKNKRKRQKARYRCIRHIIINDVIYLSMHIHTSVLVLGDLLSSSKD